MSWSPTDDTSARLDILVELGRTQPNGYSRVELDEGLRRITARLELGRTRWQLLKRVISIGLLLTLGAIASHRPGHTVTCAPSTS